MVLGSAWDRWQKPKKKRRKKKKKKSGGLKLNAKDWLKKGKDKQKKRSNKRKKKRKKKDSSPKLDADAWVQRGKLKQAERQAQKDLQNVLNEAEKLAGEAGKAVEKAEEMTRPVTSGLARTARVAESGGISQAEQDRRDREADQEAVDQLRQDRTERQRNAERADKKQNKGLLGGWKFKPGSSIRKWKESEDAERLRQRTADAHLHRNKWLGLGDEMHRIDAGTRAGLDFLLDNPNASVQDTARDGIRAGAGLVAGREVTDEDIGRGAQGAATQTKSLWDRYTPDSWVLKGGGAITDAFLAAPTKAATTGLTGVDIDTGSSEGTVGAVDAFDIGVTLGTAGVGSVGLRGARAATGSGGWFDEALNLGDEAGGLLRRGDEAAGASRATSGASRSADDVTRFWDEATDLSGLSDEAAQAVTSTTSGGVPSTAGASIGSAFSWLFRGNAARFSDEAAQLADEAGRLADEPGTLLDDATRTGDGLADEIRSSLDEWTARFSDEAAQFGDEGGGLLDEGGKVADEGGGGGGRLRNVATGKSVGGLPRWKVAAGGGGALVGGGLAADHFLGEGEVTVEDPDGGVFTLVYEKQYEPTEKHPTGGALAQVMKDGSSQGYTVVLDIRGRNIIYLGPDGSERTSKVTLEQFSQARSSNGYRPGAAGGGVSR